MTEGALVSDFVGQHFGSIIAVIYVALVWWSIHSRRRAQAIAEEGRCASCGVSEALTPAPAGEGLLCSTCAAKRRRRDRIAVPIWFATIAFGGTMLIMELLDSVREHRAIHWESGGPLALGIIGWVWLVLRYRMGGVEDARREAPSRRTRG